MESTWTGSTRPPTRSLFEIVLSGGKLLSPLPLAQILLEIALDPKARDRDRIAAVRELLDRGWGKAVGFADVESADPLEQDEVAAEIRSIAEQLRRERDAS